MRKVIFIGTIHGFTPEKELKKILDNIKPIQILIEVPKEDIGKIKLDNYPPEMVFAYNYAKTNGIKVSGFDFKVRHNKIAKNEQYFDLIKKQEGIIKENRFTWKDLNKEKNLNKLIEAHGNREEFDKEEAGRRKVMLKNIRNNVLNGGTIVILTGAGHLRFFEENFKEAEFPFR